jgi:TRAP-type mannitol/chloroaromatic compound transport system permease small subunit
MRPVLLKARPEENPVRQKIRLAPQGKGAIRRQKKYRRKTVHGRLYRGETILGPLLQLSGLIDRMNRLFAVVASVLVLLSCLISAGNAASRYLLSISSNAWLEIQWQMFAGIFLLGAPYVLQLNEHVRVDILYSGYSDRSKLWVDVFGIILFLFPVTFMMFIEGLSFFETSFARSEMSSNAGGLPLWPVKFLLPFGFLLLLLQGVSELIKRVAALRGQVALNVAYEKPPQ